MEAVQTHVFGNGLAAVYLRSPTSKVTSAVLLVGTGSRFETAQNQGIARFYNNICFQGSQEYPEKFQFWEVIDQLGISIRATVYPEYTVSYFSSEPAGFVPSLSLFLKMFFAPALSQIGLENERQLTLTEVAYSKANSQFSGLDKLTSTVFNNTSLGFNSLGTDESVKTFTGELLSQFKNQFYVSQNCLLVIIGSQKEFNWQSINEPIQVIPNGPRQTWVPFDYKQTTTIREKVSQLDKISSLNFGALCFGRSSPQRISQSLLINILYNGRNNNRLKKIHEARLVSYITPWIKIFADCGMMLVQASTLPTKEKEAQEAISKCLDELTKNTITQEELAKAKAIYKNQYLERLNDNFERGLFYGLNFFFNLAEQTPEALVAKLNSVTLPEINQVAQTIFQPNNLSWVVVGPGY